MVVLVVIGRHICLTKERCIKNTWTSCDLLVFWSPNEKKSRTSHDDITINKVPLVEMCHQSFHVFWSMKENIQNVIRNMMQQKFDYLKPEWQTETVNDADIFINQICAHTTVVVLTHFMMPFAYICSSFTSMLKVQSHIFCDDVGEKHDLIWSSVAQFQVHTSTSTHLQSA